MFSWIQTQTLDTWLSRMFSFFVAQWWTVDQTVGPVLICGRLVLKHITDCCLILRGTCVSVVQTQTALICEAHVALTMSQVNAALKPPNIHFVWIQSMPTKSLDHNLEPAIKEQMWTSGFYSFSLTMRGHRLLLLCCCVALASKFLRLHQTIHLITLRYDGERSETMTAV